MDWKVFVSVAILMPTALSLPLEFCCPPSNSISSSTLFSLKMLPPIPVQHSEMKKFVYPPITSPEAQNSAVVHEESSCCSNKSELSKAKKNVIKSRMKLRTPTGLRRIKRFPIHLDPLYQYRYLARSGQCPTAKDGQPEFYCPTPDRNGNWRCIDDFQLCDGVRHCPNGEDELPVSCLFYRVVETHLLSVSQRLNSDESRQRGVPH
ncbi:Uncharacterized protein APZ42_029439 [Daphnia magna]|uniref:Uncharacterized protein n=1 Tax=Daphnia magna TaxID=35525 RepID=A0A0P6C942_9CRUS|nr:Uncharacterized protein APZ42_029439 [Daphnia magna]